MGGGGIQSAGYRTREYGAVDAVFFRQAMFATLSHNLPLDFIKVMALAFKAEGQRLLPSQLVVKPMGGGDIAWRKWPNEAERG